jgi:hypothetical protein
MLAHGLLVTDGKGIKRIQEIGRTLAWVTSLVLGAIGM